MWFFTQISVWLCPGGFTAVLEAEGPLQPLRAWCSALMNQVEAAYQETQDFCSLRSLLAVGEMGD